MKLTRFLKYGSRVFYKRGMMPFYLIHFITENCNANCFHCLCGYHAHWERNELTLDEIERFSRSLDDLMFMFLTGGEPFLRDDIVEIAKIYARNNKVRKINIPSNGSLTEKTLRRVEEMVKALPETHISVGISLDGVGEFHNEERQFRNLFDRSIETYRGLRALERRYANFGANVTTCVTRVNQDHLGDLFDFVRDDLHAPNYFNTLTRGVPSDPRAADVDVEKFEAFSRRQDEALYSGEMQGYYGFPGADVINAKMLLSRRLVAKTYRENTWQLPCHTGKLSFVLRSTGQVFPCELLNKPLGNIREVNYDFKKIWYSKHSDDVRRFIRDQKCFCTHECFMTLNILFTARMWPKIASKWIGLKAKRARRTMARRFGPQRHDAPAPQRARS